MRCAGMLIGSRLWRAGDCADPPRLAALSHCGIRVAQGQGVVADVDPRTAENRFQWQRKPALRAIYADLYRRMAAQCVPRRTFAIGGGAGTFKEHPPRRVASDIAFAPGARPLAARPPLALTPHRP